jgi:hypothetical protein
VGGREEEDMLHDEDEIAVMREAEMDGVRETCGYKRLGDGKTKKKER